MLTMQILFVLRCCLLPHILAAAMVANVLVKILVVLILVRSLMEDKVVAFEKNGWMNE